MIKKNKKILIMVFLILIGLVTWYIVRDNKNKDSNEQFITSIIPNSNDDFYFFNDNKYVAIKRSVAGVGSRYVVANKIRSKKDKGTRIPLIKEPGYEYSWIVYDMEANMSVKEYDVYEILHTYFRDYSPKVGVNIVSYKGQDYLLAKAIDRNNNAEKIVWFDLNDEEFKSLPEELITETNILMNSSLIDSYFYVNYWNPVIHTDMWSNLEQNFNLILSPTSFSLGAESRREQLSNLTKINLFQEYPVLEGKIINEGYYIYLRPDKVSIEENFNNYLHWFALDGEESTSFSIRGYSGEKDGPMIGSYQDLIDWVQTPEGQEWAKLMEFNFVESQQ